MALGEQQKSGQVIVFAAFKDAAEARNAEQQKHNARVLADGHNASKTFTAFDMKEQHDIMRLHAEYSSASRDYDHKYENGRAFIALLACSQTREELVRITKIADDTAPEGYRYHAIGSAVDDCESHALSAVIDHARVGLAQRVEQELSNYRACARRDSIRYANKPV